MTHFSITRRALRRVTLTGTASAVVIAGLTAGAAGASAAPASGSASGSGSAGTHARALAPDTKFYVPPLPNGAVQQKQQLAKAGDGRDAALIAEMDSVPQAVWVTGGTAAQVTSSVQKTMSAAAAQKAVPVFVAYNIPGRDCSQYSAGGAQDEAAYKQWINGFAQGIGTGKAVVIVEPDALGNMPSDCGLSSSVYPYTNADRIAEVSDAVSALEADAGTSVYLDGTQNAWQNVGTMTQRLLAANVQGAQGFFLNVSNYQSNPNLIDYGTWISDCIAMATDPSNPDYNNPSACASQYYPATESDFSTYGLTSQWYAANMGNAVATTHFVIDTSRNGQGPNTMQSYANAPYDQPSSVISSLAGGNWCNSPGAGLGLRPTANTGVPLLDAYLWVKTPGQSDGQCDAAGGVRSWNYSDYTQSGWPTDSAGQNLFDPLWGVNDPAAGAWFSQQALQLARNASPALPSASSGA